jgi:ureidoacrylate peracid hydrolase
MNVDAILIVDMQNSFLDLRGKMYGIMGNPLMDIDRTIEMNRHLIESGRANQVPMIFTRHRFRPGYLDAGRWVSEHFRSVLGGALLDGTWDVEVVADLGANEGDLYVDKGRMDAFFNTDLDTILRSVSARRIAISGIVTNTCVETTARAAAMRDYDVTVVSDCCSTYRPGDQEWSFDVLDRYGLASIVTLSDLMAR